MTGELIYTTYFDFSQIGGINDMSGFYHLRNVFWMLKKILRHEVDTCF